MNDSNYTYFRYSEIERFLYITNNAFYKIFIETNEKVKNEAYDEGFSEGFKRGKDLTKND